ncbi:hypothetical protein D3C75_764530 [compost metagenome]
MYGIIAYIIKNHSGFRINSSQRSLGPVNKRRIAFCKIYNLFLSCDPADRFLRKSVLVHMNAIESGFYRPAELAYNMIGPGRFRCDIHDIE